MAVYKYKNIKNEGIKYIESFICDFKEEIIR